MIDLRTLRTMGLVATVVVAGARMAQAAPSEATSTASADRPFNVGSATTLRFQLPLSQVVLWQRGTGGSYRDGGVAVFGASLAHRFHDIIEAEAGGALIANPCGDGTQGTLRLGVSPSLSAPRPQGTHWNVRLPLLASAHAASLAGDSCDGHTESSGRVFDVAAGIDATHWGQAGSQGFNLRLLVGYGLAGLSEATLAMGFAF